MKRCLSLRKVLLAGPASESSLFFFSYLPYLTESLAFSAEIETRDTVLARSPLPITAHLCPSSHSQEVLGLYMGLLVASLC